MRYVTVRISSAVRSVASSGGESAAVSQGAAGGPAEGPAAGAEGGGAGGEERRHNGRERATGQTPGGKNVHSSIQRRLTYAHFQSLSVVKGREHWSTDTSILFN